MRVASVYKNVTLTVFADGVVVAKKKRPIVTPGEMESITFKQEQIKILKTASNVQVSLEGEK